jgi:DNA-binding HxlR family transcriptional regulator
MSIDPAQLARLTHHRWAIPVLRELAALNGAKFVTLVYRLDAHHEAIRQALDALIEIGLVIRNPGTGHPLRPEYILTPLGKAAAPACSALDTELQRRRWSDIGYLKWSLPAVRTLDLAGGQGRFGLLKESLQSATDRAISQTLSRLTLANWLGRETVPEDKRAAIYALGSPAHRIARILTDLPSLPAIAPA